MLDYAQAVGVGSEHRLCARRCRLRTSVRLVTGESGPWLFSGVFNPFRVGEIVLRPCGQADWVLVDPDWVQVFRALKWVVEVLVLGFVLIAVAPECLLGFLKKCICHIVGPVFELADDLTFWQAHSGNNGLYWDRLMDYWGSGAFVPSESRPVSQSFSVLASRVEIRLRNAASTDVRLHHLGKVGDGHLSL